MDSHPQCLCHWTCSWEPLWWSAPSWWFRPESAPACQRPSSGGERRADTSGLDRVPTDVPTWIYFLTASFHFMNSLSVNSWLETNSSLNTRVSPPCLRKNSSIKRTKKRSEKRKRKLRWQHFLELQHLGTRFTANLLRQGSDSDVAVPSRSRFWCEKQPQTWFCLLTAAAVPCWFASIRAGTPWPFPPRPRFQPPVDIKRQNHFKHWSNSESIVHQQFQVLKNNVSKFLLQ